MFRLSGYLKSLKKDGKFFYKGCPSGDCRKKVEEEGEG